MKEILLNLLSEALEGVGGQKLIDILQKLHDKDLEAYRVAVYAGHLFGLKLLPLVTNTKTKIDDAFLHAVNDAIEKSASQNGIDLSVKFSLNVYAPGKVNLSIN